MIKYVSKVAYTRLAAILSLIIGLLAFLLYWAAYSVGLLHFNSSHHMMVFATGGIEMVPYAFLILSYFSTQDIYDPLYIFLFGIRKRQSRAIVVVSIIYCLYPIFLLAVDDELLTYNISFLTMTALEIIVVLYAGYDILNRLNLRWFLRTSPYCITGICFILYAMVTMLRTHQSTFQNTNSLANAVLSFVTITYFIQVFNERFCKKQDDCTESQNPCWPMSAKEEVILMKACDKIKNAMVQLHLADKTNGCILVNSSLLIFAVPTGELAPHSIFYTLGVNKAEGILLYDLKTKQYLGCFPRGPKHHTQALLLPCDNGEQYDKTGEKHLTPAQVDRIYGICTILDYTKKP